MNQQSYSDFMKENNYTLNPQYDFYCIICNELNNTFSLAHKPCNILKSGDNICRRCIFERTQNVDTDIYNSRKSLLNHVLYPPTNIIYFNCLICKQSRPRESLACNEFNELNKYDDICIHCIRNMNNIYPISRNNLFKMISE